eukprot:6548297-Prymnesium_polylepis.3
MLPTRPAIRRPSEACNQKLGVQAHSRGGVPDGVSLPGANSYPYRPLHNLTHCHPWMSTPCFAADSSLSSAAYSDLSNFVASLSHGAISRVVSAHGASHLSASPRRLTTAPHPHLILSSRESDQYLACDILQHPNRHHTSTRAKEVICKALHTQILPQPTAAHIAPALHGYGNSPSMYMAVVKSK